MAATENCVPFNSLWPRVEKLDAGVVDGGRPAGEASIPLALCSISAKPTPPRWTENPPNTRVTAT